MTPHVTVLDPFSSLLLALYRAAREMPAAEFQDAALLLLKPVLAFDSSIWGSGALSDAGLAVHAIHLHEQPADLIDEWQRVSHQDTAAYECATRPGWVMNVHIPELYRDEHKAAIRDYATRFGIQNALIVSYQRRDMPLVNWISLYRSDAGRTFSEADRALFEALVPHVVEALTINRLIDLDVTYTEHEHRRAPVAIADRRGVVHLADGGFEEIVRIEWPGWHSNILPQPLVAVLSERTRPAFRGSAIAIDVRHVSDLCFLKARALDRADALSERERQVADEFSRGRTYKEIAHQLGISPATVRNHLQAAYAKLGVRDKAELARVLPPST